jgi:hypothetical protein
MFAKYEKDETVTKILGQTKILEKMVRGFSNTTVVGLKNIFNII